MQQKYELIQAEQQLLRTNAMKLMRDCVRIKVTRSECVIT